MAATIRAELATVETTLRENASGLRSDEPYDFIVPDIAHSVRMFPGLVDKIGLLGDPSLITEIVGAYIVIDQYCETLAMAGGHLGASNLPNHRRVVAMPAARTEFVVGLNKNMADRMRNVMRLLDQFID